MSITKAVDFTLSLPSQYRTARTARFVAHRGRSGVVVTVNGELDAANADQLIGYVQRRATSCEWLVLDLSDLEFMGTAGFSALDQINTRCAIADVSWALVSSSAVSRLLQICDSNATLPVAESLAAALATVQGNRHQLPQLVAQLR